MNTKVQHLIKNLKDTFQDSPWYGDPVMPKLKSLDFNVVNSSPINGSNTISRITQHMIAWRILVIEVLQGNSGYSIEINSQRDWPDTPPQTRQEWEGLLAELETSQEKLIALLSPLTDTDIFKKAPGRAYDLYFMVEGIIQHDIYHLGQIAYIAKQVSLTHVK